MYQPREYRHWIKDRDLVSLKVEVKETDLYIRATRNLRRKALRSAIHHRLSLERYVEQHPAFLTTLTPIPVEEHAPHIVRQMASSAMEAHVGPMAAVAGTIAENVGRDLLPFSREIIVENGGDIFLNSSKKRRVGVYAGESPFTGNISIEIEPQQTPLGICTSSGTVGHSLSFGAADAVIVLSYSTSLADAAATSIGNLINEAEDISKAIEFAGGISGLLGVLIIKDDRLGIWGQVKICRNEQTQ